MLRFFLLAAKKKKKKKQHHVYIRAMYLFGRIFCHHLRVSQRALLSLILLFYSYLATTLLIFIFPSVLRYIHFSRLLPLCITPCFSLLESSNSYTIRKNCLQLVPWFVGISSLSKDTKAYRLARVISPIPVGNSDILWNNDLVQSFIF